MSHLLFGLPQCAYSLADRNKQSVALNADNVSAFKQALPTVTIYSRANRPRAAWKVQRDDALQSAMLTADLKVAELIGL